MTKTLTRHGNSLALVIDKGALTEFFRQHIKILEDPD